MWGEALVAKNRSDLALAEIRGSKQIRAQLGAPAPQMGRGAVLCGKNDEARRQFAQAASLDLSAADRGALAKWRKVHG